MIVFLAIIKQCKKRVINNSELKIISPKTWRGTSAYGSQLYTSEEDEEEKEELSEETHEESPFNLLYPED
jgi:hypothetical protein